MATTQAEPELTETQRDLKLYAQQRLTRCIRDIAQSFEIAGIKEHALPCLGVELLKAAAAFCLYCGLSREEFMVCAGDQYNRQRKIAMKGD
jgi:hypothetical protein